MAVYPSCRVDVVWMWIYEWARFSTAGSHGLWVQWGSLMNSYSTSRGTWCGSWFGDVERKEAQMQSRKSIKIKTIAMITAILNMINPDGGGVIKRGICKNNIADV
jgi:hypothetical protein